jgi:hypothetical protein
MGFRQNHVAKGADAMTTLAPPPLPQLPAPPALPAR